jgi:mannose-6-phosphate isomerase-like protein (cupin superfamily)
MKATALELLRQLPGPVSDKWPMGERFALAMSHGSMSVELYVPIGNDPQTQHSQDELYFIQSGTGVLVIAGEHLSFAAGTCLFVPAGVEHKFERFSPDFSTWVVFWGPSGGESAA